MGKRLRKAWAGSGVLALLLCALATSAAVQPLQAKAVDQTQASSSDPIDPATCQCFVELPRQTNFAPPADENGVDTPVAHSNAAMIRARQYFFGENNVNPRTGAVRSDAVIFDWVNNTDWAVAINGHVVLWGAYLIDPDGLTPTDFYQLAALRPDYLIVGHGHSDHLPDGGRVLYESPTTKLLGTPEHCDQVNLAMRSAVAPAHPSSPYCIFAVPRGDFSQMCGDYAGPCGVYHHFDDLIPGVQMLTFRHPHSSSGELPTPGDPLCPPVGACTPTFITEVEPQVPAMTAQRNDGVPQGNGDEGGSLFWEFHVANEYGSMNFVWNDSLGANKIGDPTWKAYRGLPYQPDLQISSIATFNYPTTGFRDAMAVIAGVRPRIFIPQHLEGLAGLQGLQSINSGGFRTAFDTQAGFTFPAAGSMIDGQLVKRPGEIWPDNGPDYLRPYVFTLSAFGPPAGQTAAATSSPATVSVTEALPSTSRGTPLAVGLLVALTVCLVSVLPRLRRVR